MSDNFKDFQTANPSQPPINAQDAMIDESEEAMRQLKICPSKVLESLEHLRIEKARIKPLENQASKSGGKADVEAAILVPAQSSNFLGSEDAQYVALKKLRFDTDTDDDRVLAPFAHEVKLLNDLSHPGVVKVVGFVEDVEQGIAWMVFSWEKNGNLREFVRSADWELPERVSLIHDVADGLFYLHGRTPPICHGDLKSLNVLVNSRNRAFITDFGSARTAAISDAGAEAVITLQHKITTIGSTMESLKAELAASGDFITMTGPAWTIRWAAPELLEGELPGLASDIWALGWICWEAVTGNFPFDEENDLAIVLRITRGDLPAAGDNAQLKQIKALCSLMGECWRLNANERPTAIRCKQVISFMNLVIPLNNKKHGSATTRSSGLLHALGWIEMQNGEIPEGRKYFQESFEVAKSVGDTPGRARALYALGEADRMLNEYSKAEVSYIEARSTYSQIGDQIGIADSFKGLGHIYQMRNEYSKAEDSYIQARDTYAQIGHQFGFASSVLGLGDVCHVRNEVSKAEESYIQARDAYSQIGNQEGFAGSVKGLGDVYQLRREYSKAEESYIQARDTFSHVGNQLGFAHSVSRLGDLSRTRGEYASAEASYIQARDAYSQIGDQQGFAGSVLALGEVYRMRYEYSKAEESYTQARDIYAKIGSPFGFANSVQGLGRTNSALEQYPQAEESYLEAQAVYRQIGDMLSLADNLWYLGWLRRRQAQYGEAERLICEASILYGKFSMETDVADCDKFLRDVRQLMGV